MRTNYDCYLSKRANETYCLILKGMPLCDFFDFDRVLLIAKKFGVKPDAIWFNGKFESI